MKYCYCIISYFIIAGCWKREHSKRPSFTQVKAKLVEIQKTEFLYTSDEEFKSLQSTWKKEVKLKFNDLKKIESVSMNNNLCVHVNDDI